jgi:cytochrome c nitrite reductase small subunit
MLDDRKKKFLIYSIISSFVFMLFLIAGPPKLLEKTSSPEFCNSCHVMNNMYESWFITGLHRSIKCVDCHLPNNNIVNHILWKGIDGMNDVVRFNTGFYKEPIYAGNHARKVLKDNCVRCHSDMVSFMETGGRDCWSCHRRVTHRIVDIVTK